MIIPLMFFVCDPEELDNIYDENLEIIHLYKKKLFSYFKNNEIKLNF